MRLLHIGIFDNNEPQEALRKALSDISSEYHEFNYSSYGNRVNELLLSYLGKADVVFLQIQREGVVKPTTARALKESGIKVFNFTGDVRQPVPHWYLELAPYATTLFTNLTDAEYLRGLGYDAHYFQVGYSDHIYNTKAAINHNAPEIVFMGNNYNKMFPLSDFRKEMVDTLKARYGNRFQVYGSGWGNSPSLMFKQKEEASTYRGCKIAINLSHFDLKRYSSDRLFRILGCGAFCLSHKFQEIEEEFKNGEHLVTWSTIPELCMLIDEYLPKEEERKRIAENGNKFCEQEYTWKKRMEQLLQIIG